MVTKLMVLKIREIKKYGEKLNKKLLVKVMVENDRFVPSVCRKVNKELINFGNRVWN